jgi:hypothetical protein
VYDCIGILKKDVRSRCKDTVAELRVVVSDLDLKHIVEPPDKVIEVLKDLVLPPSEIRDSGFGLHSIWRLKEAVDDIAGLEQAESIMARMAALLAGDPAPTHRAALLRRPGTDNTKVEGAPRRCHVIEQGGQEYDVTEFEDMFDLYGDRPLLTSKKEPSSGNGHTTPDGFKPPIDVDARLAEMRWHGPGDTAINIVQRDVMASMLKQGIALEEATAVILEATRKCVAGDPAAASIDWEDQKRTILWSGARWINKNPELAYTLPESLRRKFEALSSAGKRPSISKNRGGIFVRGLSEGEAGDDKKAGQPQAEAGDRGELRDFSKYVGQACRFGDPLPASLPMLVPFFVPAAKVLGYLGAQWGAFKTFLIADEGVGVATGTTWAGQKIANPGFVLHIELENSEMLLRSMAAAAARKVSGDLPIIFSEHMPPTIIRNGRVNPEWIDWCDGIGDYVRINAKGFGVPPRLVTLDAQNRFAGFRDEQSAAEGNVVINGLLYLVKKVDCGVQVADHLGKDASAGLRGTSVKHDGPYYILNCGETAKSDLTDTRYLSVMKMKGGEPALRRHST